MVFGLITSDGKKLDPVFLPRGLRMGSKEYLDQVLVPHVSPRFIANYIKAMDVVLMQNGAPTIPQR